MILWKRILNSGWKHLSFMFQDFLPFKNTSKIKLAVLKVNEYWFTSEIQVKHCILWWIWDASRVKVYQLFSMFCSALLDSLETKAGLIRHLQFTGNFHIRISFRARNVLASRIVKTKQTLGAMFLDVLCPFLGQREKKVSCLDWPHYFFSYFLFSFLATNWDTLALHTITQCSVTGLHFCFLVPN